MNAKRGFVKHCYGCVYLIHYPKPGTNMGTELVSPEITLKQCKKNYLDNAISG